MQEQEQLTRCYVITGHLDALLKKWAKANDRTASAELRQILEGEAQRRQAQEQKPINQLSH